MAPNMVITGRGVELMTPKEHAVINQLALTQMQTEALHNRAAQVRAELRNLQVTIAAASAEIGASKRALMRPGAATISVDAVDGNDAMASAGHVM